MVMGAAYLYNIHGTDALIKFYDNGFGPLADMPLWAQAITFLVVSDFLLYWFHRLYHGAALWKYHAVHHSSKELDWISAARFHPVNILFGTVLVDVALLLAGISPNVMLWVGPFTTASSAFVHANLNWTLGPFKYVIAGPVFHRWHHTAAGPRRQHEFRRHLPDLGPAVRHLLHAGKRAAGCLWHRRPELPGELRRPDALSVPQQARPTPARALCTSFTNLQSTLGMAGRGGGGSCVL